MDSRSALEEGAGLLISRNLDMWRGQDVAIIVDESTYEVGLELEKAALKHQVRPTVIHISRAQQANYDSLNTPLARAIGSAQALITAVCDDTNSTGFRVAILKEGQGSQLKIAHMPGITLDMIASLTETDYKFLESGCEALRKPLLLGHDVQITTTDHQGSPHSLNLTLGGWDFPPIISSGIVQHNSFDNVPSGEVYVPPIKGTAQGSVVINGSITGYVFEGDDEIVAHFASGALINMEPFDHPAAQILRQRIERASTLGDREPHYLCEFGIGVNTAVKKLTGGNLIDEKAYGTAHVAIGTNDEFGGTVKAENIHEDLVFFRPTIHIDDRLIVQDGEFAIEEADWRPDYNAINNPTPFDREETFIEWTGTQAIHNLTTNFLERTYIDGTGVKCKITVGSDETARLAARVYHALPKDKPVSIKDLCQTTQLPQLQLQKILYTMSKSYRLVQAL